LFTYRDYDLDIFNISPNFVVPDNNFIIEEKFFHHNLEIDKIVEKNIDKNVLLLGQWQSYLYFDEVELRRHFNFKDNIENSDIYTKHLLAKIRNSNSVMLNIRRTDYLNNDFHGVIGLDYINKSVEIISSKVNQPEFFIFSDDIEWCSQNINLKNMTIVDHKYKGYKFSYYLQLMSNCKHFIIPNSTFAWWSAWLNTNTDKIVISPKRWFNREDINTNDLIPDNWIRI